MSMITNSLSRFAERIRASQQPGSPTLVRWYVETGDERCPLAGIWMPIQQSDATTDEPEIAWPAVWSLLSWRAIHRLLISPAYIGL